MHDRLDKLALAAIVLLVVFATSLVAVQMMQPEPQGPNPEEARKAALAQRSFDPNFAKKITMVKKMLAGGNIETAGKLVQELVVAYPYDGLPNMLLGDIYLRRQDVIGAALEYRKAVDLNPDFLDKKAAEFQGKKIKRTVEEALTIIEKDLQGGNRSKAVLEHKKAMYYMLRKIAGSCS